MDVRIDTDVRPAEFVTVSSWAIAKVLIQSENGDTPSRKVGPLP
jgi:hypothetical protein